MALRNDRIGIARTLTLTNEMLRPRSSRRSSPPKRSLAPALADARLADFAATAPPLPLCIAAARVSVRRWWPLPTTFEGPLRLSSEMTVAMTSAAGAATSRSYSLIFVPLLSAAAAAAASQLAANSTLPGIPSATKTQPLSSVANSPIESNSPGESPNGSNGEIVEVHHVHSLKMEQSPTNSAVTGNAVPLNLSANGQAEMSEAQRKSPVGELKIS